MFVDKVLKKIPREIYIYILWGIVVGAVNLGSAWIFMYKCGIETCQGQLPGMDTVQFCVIHNK